MACRLYKPYYTDHNRCISCIRYNFEYKYPDKTIVTVMSTYIEVSMVAEPNYSDKQEIDIPVAWSNITGLQQFNTLSGKCDNIPLTTFITTSTTQTVQGASVAYTKYTHNGAKIGARQLRFI